MFFWDFPLILYNLCEKLYCGDRCILGFLIPARLLTHPREMPSDQLIDSFGLSEFKPVVQALRCGSVKLFNDCIESHLETFIQRYAAFFLYVNGVSIL